MKTVKKAYIGARRMYLERVGEGPVRVQEHGETRVNTSRAPTLSGDVLYALFAALRELEIESVFVVEESHVMLLFFVFVAVLGGLLLRVAALGILPFVFVVFFVLLLGFAARSDGALIATCFIAPREDSGIVDHEDNVTDIREDHDHGFPPVH